MHKEVKNAEIEKEAILTGRNHSMEPRLLYQEGKGQLDGEIRGHKEHFIHRIFKRCDPESEEKLFYPF